MVSLGCMGIHYWLVVGRGNVAMVVKRINLTINVEKKVNFIELIFPVDFNYGDRFQSL